MKIMVYYIRDEQQELAYRLKLFIRYPKNENSYRLLNEHSTTKFYFSLKVKKHK